MLKSSLGKFIKFTLSVILVTNLLQSCTGKKADEVSKATKAGILLMGNGTEPKDLDPHIATGVPEHHIINALFEGLIGEDPKDLHPVPGVASSWEIKDGGNRFVFKLNPNAKWSNGDQVTASDFVYSWKRVLSPKLASEYAYMLHVVKNAKAFNESKINDFSQVGVKAIDDTTLEVTLENPTPYFLSLLQHYSTYPVHKATIEKFGKMDESGTMWTRSGNLVGNGPFVLKKWELNKIIEVEKSPTYWDAATVKLNRVHFFPIESDQTEERKFRAGGLHVTNTVPLTKIPTYQKKNPELILITPYLGTYYYRVNVTKKPFDDPRVRRALSLSIDRKAIVERITKAGEMAAFSFVPPDCGGYNSESTLEFNIEKAKALLSEAGFNETNPLPPVDILYNTLESHKVIAEAIQQMWKTNLGIQATLTNQDWKVYLSSQKSLNYTVSRAGWIGDYADPNTFMDMFVTDGGNNQTGWSNKEYDALIAEAARTLDPAKRLAVFQKAEKIILDESPLIPIYTYVNKRLIRPELKGWLSNIQDHHPYKHIWLESQENVQITKK